MEGPPMPDLRSVHSPDAPAAIGPYSQAIIANGIVYTAGQIALDPRTGDLSGGDVATQTARVLDNLTAVLAAAGASLGTVVRTTVYLADMAEFGAMNEVYGRYFGDHKPARSTVQAAALPRGA